MSFGMGMPASTAATLGTMADSAAAAVAPRSRRYRPGPPDEVFFPVTPMLDMAFQLLAFFILTFKAPSAETHIDLYLPATPAALPSGPRGQARPSPSRAIDADLENDLFVRAEADDLGDLKALRLGEAIVPDLPALGSRLRRYTQLLGNRPLRVRLVADDRLRDEPATRIIATCSAAGITSVRLAQPGTIGALRGRRLDRVRVEAHDETGARHQLALARGSAPGLRRLVQPVRNPAATISRSRPGLALRTWPRSGGPVGKGHGRRCPCLGARAPVTFHELWDHPETWRGCRVQVRGRSPGSSAKTPSAAFLRWRRPG